MAGRLTQRNRQRVGRIERPALAGEPTQGGCPDQAADLIGQSLQASNPLLVAGTVGESPLSAGDDELISAFERVGSEVALHEGDHDYLGVGKIRIVIIRPTPGGHLRIRLQVVVDEQIAFEKVGFEITRFYFSVLVTGRWSGSVRGSSGYSILRTGCSSGHLCFSTREWDYVTERPVSVTQTQPKTKAPPIGGIA